jgi:predicted flap endonuclease-1-like 5' DNA nuclease
LKGESYLSNPSRIVDWVDIMRLDYPLYALAAVFFIVTAVSLVLITEQVQQSLWVVTTVVLGLFSIGLGYTQRPKAKVTSSQPSTSEPKLTMTEPLNPAVDDAHEAEAFRGENVGKTVEPQILPQSTSPVPMQVVAPTPVLAPAPVEPSVPTSPDFKRVKGLGMNRAAQLQALGINNLEDLAKASAEELATELKISPKITKMWIGQAKKLAK